MAAGNSQQQHSAAPPPPTFGDAQSAFVRSVLEQECQKSPYLSRINLVATSTSELRELLNCKNSLEMRMVPIVVCKYITRLVLIHAKGYLPDEVSGYLKPENISTDLASDELQYLLSHSGSGESGIVTIFLKNITVQMLGASLTSFCHELKMQTTAKATAASAAAAAAAASTAAANAEPLQAKILIKESAPPPLVPRPPPPARFTPRFDLLTGAAKPSASELRQLMHRYRQQQSSPSLAAGGGDSGSVRRASSVSSSVSSSSSTNNSPGRSYHRPEPNTIGSGSGSGGSSITGDDNDDSAVGSRLRDPETGEFMDGSDGTAARTTDYGYNKVAPNEDNSRDYKLPTATINTIPDEDDYREGSTTAVPLPTLVDDTDTDSDDPTDATATPGNQTTDEPTDTDPDNDSANNAECGKSANNAEYGKPEYDVPAAEAEYNGPAAEYETPAAEAEYETPAAEYETPAAEAEYETPAADYENVPADAAAYNIPAEVEYSVPATPAEAYEPPPVDAAEYDNPADSTNDHRNNHTYPAGTNDHRNNHTYVEEEEAEAEEEGRTSELVDTRGITLGEILARVETAALPPYAAAEAADDGGSNDDGGDALAYSEAVIPTDQAADDGGGTLNEEEADDDDDDDPDVEFSYGDASPPFGGLGPLDDEYATPFGIGALTPPPPRNRPPAVGEHELRHAWLRPSATNFDESVRGAVATATTAATADPFVDDEDETAVAVMPAPQSKPTSRRRKRRLAPLEPSTPAAVSEEVGGEANTAADVTTTDDDPRLVSPPKRHRRR